VAGTAPEFKATGLGAKMYGGLIDRMRRVVNKPFATTGQKVVNNVLGAAPAAALAAVDPVGSAAHYAINTGRELLGTSGAGKRLTEKAFKSGLYGTWSPSPVTERAIDLVVSPAVLDPYRIGRDIRTAVGPEKVQQMSRTLETVPDAAAPSLVGRLRTLVGQH
jgi:hypothetical protein